MYKVVFTITKFRQSPAVVTAEVPTPTEAQNFVQQFIALKRLSPETGVQKIEIFRDGSKISKKALEKLVRGGM